MLWLELNETEIGTAHEVLIVWGGGIGKLLFLLRQPSGNQEMPCLWGQRFRRSEVLHLLWKASAREGVYGESGNRPFPGFWVTPQSGRRRQRPGPGFL